MTYLKKIDGLRFIAIMAVLVHHMASVFSTYIDWGYFGVDLFFVISGFLITMILLKSIGPFQSVFKNFLARRSLRIFPLYYFVLIILFFLGNPIVRDNFTYLLTYTYNYRMPLISTHNPIEHLWSLSVEEQFYLFWPFVVIGMRKRLKTLKIIILILVTFAYIQIHFSIIPQLQLYNYTGLPSRMGSLGLGALGSIIFLNPSLKFKSMLQNPKIELVFSLIFLVALLYRIPILLGLCSLYLVLKAAFDSFQTKWINRLLTHPKALYIGRISYGLYIYHVPVIFYLTPHIFDPLWNSINFESFGSLSFLQYHSWILKFPFYFLVTLALASVSYKYFESPILVLKDRFFQSKLKPAVVLNNNSD